MYKKDGYIAFLTNEPQVHFNEMFGYNDLTVTVDDFEKTNLILNELGYEAKSYQENRRM